MAKECTLSTGKLLLGDLPRNSVVRITDLRNMTSAVYNWHKATNKQIKSFQDSFISSPEPKAHR